MKRWHKENGSQLSFVQKGSPQQNAYEERFNSTYREEVGSAYAFSSRKQISAFTNSWMWAHNKERLDQSIQNLPPVVFALNDRKRFKFSIFQDDVKNTKGLILNLAN